MKLKNQVSIVTGASSGIGRGITEVFVEEGARVVLADRNEQGGRSVEAALRRAGGDALFIQCDVSDESQVRSMVEQTVAAHGLIDVLVNNAGVNFVKPFDQMTLEEWDQVINVDLRGVFLCTQACINHFLKQGGGSVVNIASVHTQAGMPWAAAYDAAKWGVVGLTKSLAVEYAARHIRFNCVSPGLIDTQIWQDMLDATEDVEACKAHWWDNIPAGRIGTPHEMGKVAAFLASDEASYVTGANYVADGGMTSQLISRERTAK